MTNSCCILFLLAVQYLVYIHVYAIISLLCWSMSSQLSLMWTVRGMFIMSWHLSCHGICTAPWQLALCNCCKHRLLESVAIILIAFHLQLFLLSAAPTLLRISTADHQMFRTQFWYLIITSRYFN